MSMDGTDTDLLRNTPAENRDADRNDDNTRTKLGWDVDGSWANSFMENAATCNRTVCKGVGSTIRGSEILGSTWNAPGHNSEVTGILVASWPKSVTNCGGITENTHTIEAKVENACYASVVDPNRNFSHSHSIPFKEHEGKETLEYRRTTSILAMFFEKGHLCPCNAHALKAKVENADEPTLVLGRNDLPCSENPHSHVTEV